MRTLIILFLMGLATYAYCNKHEKKSSDFDQIPDPTIREFFQMRQKLLDDVQKSFFSDHFNFQTFDHDDFFQNLNFESNSLYSTSWTEDQNGRVLKIVPSDKKTPLDIDIKEGVVTIKAKSEGDKGSNQVISNFSSSFSIPSDVEEKKANLTDKNGEIWIHFPWKVGKLKNKSKIENKEEVEKEDEGIRPLKPEPSDITI